MQAPAHITQGLQNIRSTLRMIWNPMAVRAQAGRISADGMVTSAAYDGRWEVWDTDPEGGDYMVMRVETPTGEYMPPVEWVVEWLNRWNPEHFNGSLEKMLEVYFANAEEAAERMSDKNAKDFFDAVSKWAAWVALPKSGAALSYRGARALSPQNQ